MNSQLRNGRRNLLPGNKVKKYLLYAIGEITLVVIGILIALQINALEKENDNKSLEKTSLENLKEDLRIQKENVEQQLESEAMFLQKIDSGFAFLQNPYPLENLAHFAK